jgi:hypothetical protein
MAVDVRIGKGAYVAVARQELQVDMETGETRWYSFRPLSCN